MVELNINYVLQFAAIIIAIVLVINLTIIKDKNKGVIENVMYQLRNDATLQFYVLLVVMAFVVPMFTDNPFIIYTLTALTGIIAIQYLIAIIRVLSI